MPQQPAGSSISVVMASDAGPHIASDSLTRQNNTTPYNAGDIVCAMAGDGWTPTAQQVLAFRLHLDRN